jgi:hypothetical protein
MKARIPFPPRFPLALILFSLLVALLLGACSASDQEASAPAASNTEAPPTAAPSPTPTPVPAILATPRKSYTSPKELFRIEVPENWDALEDGGGIRFQDPVNPYISLTAFYFPLPRNADALEFLQAEAERALSRPKLNDPDSLQVIRQEISEEGRLQLEAVGKFFDDQPLQHMRIDAWVENNVLLGLNLMTPVEYWDEIEPIWPVVRQSYQVLQPDPSQVTGMAYIHPGGLFTVTVPMYWGILEEDYDGVLLQDMGGLAHYGVSVQELDHYPTPEELDDALTNLLGAAPEAPGYLELQKVTNQPNLRMIQFEVPTEEDGIYRTEIRVFGDRNLLITTVFSAPPQDWDYFAPDYELLLNSIQTRGNAPPDEKTQDEDPLAGLEVGVVRFYLANNGRLQVSAPIRNFRTRPVTRITASVILYDQEGNFLAAESWRMLQQIVGPGKTTYLYLSLPPATADFEKVAQVRIQLLDARDAKRQPYPSWQYERGSAEEDAKGNIVIRATLRNAGKKVQKYLFVAALLYDENGNLLFIRTERKRLRYATPPGQEVDIKMVIPGPLEGIASFDIIGERPVLD